MLKDLRKDVLVNHVFTAALGATTTSLIAWPAVAQFDAAADAKWSKVEIVHFEAVEEIADKHAQIPPVDADLYADVSDRVTLSFDWNKNKNIFVGTPKFQNQPGKATNLVGMEKKCPTGKLNGPYEHFDIVEIKQSAPGEAPELVGKRIHRRSNLLTRTAPDRPEIDEGRDVGLEDFRLEVGVGELLDVRAGHSNLRYCCLCNLAAGPRQPHRLAGHA